MKLTKSFQERRWVGSQYYVSGCLTRYVVDNHFCSISFIFFRETKIRNIPRYDFLEKNPIYHNISPSSVFQCVCWMPSRFPVQCKFTEVVKHLPVSDLAKHSQKKKKKKKLLCSQWMKVTQIPMQIILGSRDYFHKISPLKKPNELIPQVFPLLSKICARNSPQHPWINK